MGKSIKVTIIKTGEVQYFPSYKAMYRNLGKEVCNASIRTIYNVTHYSEGLFINDSIKIERL